MQGRMGTGGEVFYFTHAGGVRPNNEDGLLISNRIICEKSMDSAEFCIPNTQKTIFCVADGIGGSDKGEIASKIVLSHLDSHYSEISDEESAISVLTTAKIELDRYAEENPESFNLGCTIAGILIVRQSVVVFNAGDCRVYRIRDHYFERITRDHSIVQSLYENGTITEEEMRHHPRKNVVTSSLSGDGSPYSLKINVKTLPLREDDRFFICSDGIWSCFSHDDLEMIYERYQGIEFCSRLLIAALARRASDNISVILVHYPSLIPGP